MTEDFNSVKITYRPDGHHYISARGTGHLVEAVETGDALTKVDTLRDELELLAAEAPKGSKLEVFYGNLSEMITNIHMFAIDEDPADFNSKNSVVKQERIELANYIMPFIKLNPEELKKLEWIKLVEETIFQRSFLPTSLFSTPGRKT